MRSASSEQQGLKADMIDEGIYNYQQSEVLTDQEKMALKFSDLMDKTPNAINEEFYEELAEHFSIPEIVELGAFIGFNIGFHRFFGTLQFYPMFSPEGELVDQEKSKEAYGDKPVSHKSFGNAQ